MIALLDTVVSSAPKRLVHLWAPMLFGITYLTFNVIYTVSGGTDPNGGPIYPITDWLNHPGISSGFVLAVVVLVVTVHCGIWGLAKGRDALWSKHVRQGGADEKLALNKGPDYGATSQSIVVTMS